MISACILLSRKYSAIVTPEYGARTCSGAASEAVSEATLAARKSGQLVRLQPEKRYYPAARMPTTETAIHKSASGDLYLALGDRRVVDGQVRWTFRAYFNPLIDLVFGGVALMALGGLLSVLPRRPALARKRATETEALPAGEPAE